MSEASKQTTTEPSSEASQPTDAHAPSKAASSDFAGVIFGLAGERKATVLLCLAFYTALFGLLSLLLWSAPPDQPEVRAWWGFFAAMAASYGVAFFSLGAGWFWARWFAMGLGYSGLTIAFWSIISQRTIDPVIGFYGLTHGIIALFLGGQRLTQEFDGKPGWRKALGLDENGVQRVRHTVTRAATTLPTLIMIALAPREGTEGLLAATLCVVGVWGLLRARTLGVLALLAAAPLSIIAALSHQHVGALSHASHLRFVSPDAMHGLSLLAGFILLGAVAPYLSPMARFLTSPGTR